MHEMDVPMRFPGLPSVPKNSGLEVRALLRLERRDVRPSSPVIGLEEVTCIASFVLSTVIFSNPAAKTHQTQIPFIH